MKQMRNIFLTAISVIACMAAISCQKEINTPSTKTEGLPLASMSFGLNIPEENATITRATGAQETAITNCALLFMKKLSDGTSEGAKVFFFDNLGDPSQVVSTTDYVYQLKITSEEFEAKDMRSGEYYIYAIGNYNTGFVNFTKDEVATLIGKTKAEVEAVIVNKTNKETDFQETGVFMTGIYGTTDGVAYLKSIDEAPEEYQLEGRIHLRRFVSKVTINIGKGENVTSFTVNSIELHNYSSSASLFERKGWNNTDPADVQGDYMGNASLMRDITTTMNKNTDGSYSLSFYMPENLQRAATTLGSYNDRELHVSDADQSFSKAPAKAAYFVIKGRYHDANYSGSVTYTIHLGDFSNGNTKKGKTGTGSYSNFSVRRNYKYNYYITVNGVKNIITEATVKENGKSKEVQSGAEGHIVGKAAYSFIIDLDSHYETVLLKMAIPTANKVDAFTVQTETPFAATDNMVTYDRIQQSDAENIAQLARKTDLDYQWVHFAQPSASLGLAKYGSTGDGTVADIFQLLDELKAVDSLSTYTATSANHFVIGTDGGTKFIYALAYIDENYYQDKMDAASTNEEKTAVLKKFVNVNGSVGPRVLTVSFGGAQKSDDLQSTYIANILFSFSQRAIASSMDLSLANPMGVETIEETPTSATYSVNSLTSKTTGWQNTADNVVGKTWSTIVDDTMNGYDQVYDDPFGDTCKLPCLI